MNPSATDCLYDADGLELTDHSVRFEGRTISLEDLPDPRPAHPARLRGVSALIERLWRIALSDVESDVVRDDSGRYFGAGRSFGKILFTRDIAYSGILSLNRLYPEIMRDSLEFTRRLHLDLLFRAPRAYHIPEIAVDWQLEDCPDDAFAAKHQSSCYLRRTDDVVWLWAAADLAEHSGRLDDWRWIHRRGTECFDKLYDPFFDPADGLFRGQASFVDVHFPDRQASGYPREWTIADCILLKAASTNALYFKGLKAMSRAARMLGEERDAAQWQERADRLGEAIRRELRHADGSFAFWKDRHGKLSGQREALGTALNVLAGVVRGAEAARALEALPVGPRGVPLFLPFFPLERCYHNHSSWAFVDTFYLRACEQATGRNFKPLNLALLARMCIDDGTFHELSDYRTGMPKGSGSQLWTAAAFLDVCLRSGFDIENCDVNRP